MNCIILTVFLLNSHSVQLLFWFWFTLYIQFLFCCSLFLLFCHLGTGFYLFYFSSSIYFADVSVGTLTCTCVCKCMGRLKADFKCQSFSTLYIETGPLCGHGVHYFAQYGQQLAPDILCLYLQGNSISGRLLKITQNFTWMQRMQTLAFTLVQQALYLLNNLTSPFASPFFPILCFIHSNWLSQRPQCVSFTLHWNKCYYFI